MREVVMILLVTGGCSFDPQLTADAGTNAGADALPDPPMIDAFVNPCPPTYTISIDGSHYRAITSNQKFWTHDGTCQNDAAGLTHLAVFESASEMSTLTSILDLGPTQPTNNWYYVGAVQQKSSGAVATNWSWFVGGGVAMESWGILNSIPQPNDADGIESNSENLAVLDASQGRMLDVSGSSTYGAVCECDSRPTMASIRAQIPPPN